MSDGYDRDKSSVIYLNVMTLVFLHQIVFFKTTYDT